MANETKYPKMSIENRISSQLASVTDIEWPGVELDTDGLTDWIAPEILGFSSTPSRAGERIERWSVSFNCFVRTGPDGGETTHKVHELVDACIAAFGQYDLPVVNWGASDPKPTLYYLRFGEAQVQPVTGPEEEGRWFMQQNVTFDGTLITA